MNPALLITLASVLVGGALAALTSRGGTVLEGLRTFAITAVATLAAVQLLPESVERIGAWALLLFVGALALPPVFTSVARRVLAREIALTAHGVGAELGYFGFVAHQFVEGLALGAYAGGMQDDRIGLVLAVAAHTVPMTALFIGTVVIERGRRPAIRRVVALLAASSLGFFAADWVTGGIADAVAPTLAALIAGFLCHVLLHGVGPSRHRRTATRLLDVIAVGAGIALPLSSVHSAATAGESLHHALADAWIALALETAPVLLLGLLMGTALQLIGPRVWARGPHSPAASQQALAGIAIGAPLPLCACGVLPVAERLRGRGAGAALVIAFLISAPELGPETLMLTVGFMGWAYAIVRVVAALLLAYVAGLAFAGLVARSSKRAPLPATPPETDARPVVGALRCFDELLLRTAPWTVVGLLAAAYIEVSFAADSLTPLANSGLDVIVIALIALPTYVCAASATPMAAVLVLKGISPGAVLVGLLLGPTTNIATIAMLGRAYGRRTAWLGLAVVAIAACGLGLAVNFVSVPMRLPTALHGVHTHGLASWAAVTVLAAMLVAQLWRWGLGPWLEILDAGGHAHGHEHSGAGDTHVHDHADGDHHHDHGHQH